MKASIRHAHGIEIKYIAPTKTKGVRLKAIEFDHNGKEQSITMALDYGATTAQIEELIEKMTEKYKLNYLRDGISNMSMAKTKVGWFVTIPV